MSDIVSSLRAFFLNVGKPTDYDINQVKQLTWMRIVSEQARDQGLITAEQIYECTAKAAHEVGEDSSVKKFLLTRCKFLEQLIKEKCPELIRQTPISFKVGIVGWVFIILAFFAGVLTNQFSVNGHRINLLSPPLVGLLIWNLLVYLWLIVTFLFSAGGDWFGPFRKFVAWIITKLETSGNKHNQLLTEFYSIWLPKESTLLKVTVAEILHFSAFALGCGIIASIAVRGWGTAYTVGWESTWLAESPDSVLSFIKIFYGLVPLNDGLLTSLTPQAVQAMRFDVGPGAPAAPWLIRLSTIVFMVVVLPRAWLAYYAHSRVKFLKSHFPINLESTYYQGVLRQRKGEIMTIQVIPFAYNPSEAIQNNIKQLFADIHPEGSTVQIYPSCFEDTKLPEVVKGEFSECIALFAMTSTPEAEVHGRFIEELKNACRKQGTTVKVLVDSSTFIARFGKTPQRVEQRQTNWKNFLVPYSVTFAFSDLSHLNSKEVAEQFDTAR